MQIALQQKTWCETFSSSKMSQRSGSSTRIRLSQTQTIWLNNVFPYVVFTCSTMGLQEYPWGLPVILSPFNPLMNLNCSKRQMDCKRSKHVVVLLGGNKRSHCTAPLSSSGALVESLFSSSLNRSWIEAGMRIGSAITPLPDSPLWIHWGCMRSYSPTTTWALSHLPVNRHISQRSTSWPSGRTGYGGKRLDGAGSEPKIRPTLQPEQLQTFYSRKIVPWLPSPSKTHEGVLADLYIWHSSDTDQTASSPFQTLTLRGWCLCYLLPVWKHAYFKYIAHCFTVQCLLSLL